MRLLSLLRLHSLGFLGIRDGFGYDVDRSSHDIALPGTFPVFSFCDVVGVVPVAVRFFLRIRVNLGEFGARETEVVRLGAAIVRLLPLESRANDIASCLQLKR